MRVIISIVSLSVGIPCLLGCSAEHVSAVEDSHALISEGEPIPGDPWGVCNLDWKCSNPDGDCLGWVEPGSCQEPCVIEGFLIGCVHWCATSADCPVPLSGEAVPTCSEGTCLLSCESGSCPNGYSCIASDPRLDGSNPYPPHMCMEV